MFLWPTSHPPYRRQTFLSYRDLVPRNSALLLSIKLPPRVSLSPAEFLPPPWPTTRLSMGVVMAEFPVPKWCRHHPAVVDFSSFSTNPSKPHPGAGEIYLACCDSPFPQCFSSVAVSVVPVNGRSSAWGSPAPFEPGGYIPDTLRVGWHIGCIPYGHQLADSRVSG